MQQHGALNFDRKSDEGSGEGEQRQDNLMQYIYIFYFLKKRVDIISCDVFVQARLASTHTLHPCAHVTPMRTHARDHGRPSTPAHSREVGRRAVSVLLQPFNLSILPLSFLFTCVCSAANYLADCCMRTRNH